VMIREGLTPGARNASLMLTPSGLLYFQYRTWSSGTTQSVIASAHTPTWVKLTRTGSTLTAAYSTDGVTYTGLGAQGFTFGGPLVIGLAVSSRSNTELATGILDSVTLNTGTNTPPTVSITQPAANATFTVGNAVTLKANATDSNGSVTRVDYYATTITGTIAFST